MINIYKTIDNKIREINAIEKDAWIHMTDPTEVEINEIVGNMGIELDFLRAALDESETSHIEIEDNQTLIIIDIPQIEQENKLVTYTTIPMGIIVTNDNIVTVCLKESMILNAFAKGSVKGVHTNLKTRFVLQLLYRVAVAYLLYLRQVDKLSSHIEKQLHLSMKNKELIQLLDLEKSLVFFSTSLKANEVTLEKLARGRVIKLYEEDSDLLEDVLIEVKQAIEMSTIYSNILSGTMDAFASIISNNLNIVMKRLTVFTIILAIPTMIASFFGMNVEHIPFPNFWVIIIIAILVTGFSALFLYKKDMF